MPLPQPPIILTREGFREWLTKLPADTRMRQGKPCHCALAQYIADSTGYSPVVGWSRFHFNDAEMPGSFELPTWARRFIEGFDEAESVDGELGPLATLAVLDGLPK